MDYNGSQQAKSQPLGNGSLLIKQIKQEKKWAGTSEKQATIIYIDTQ